MVMGLLQNLGGGLKSPGPDPKRSPTQQKFRKHFTVFDGDAAFDTVAEVVAIIDAQAAGGIFELVWQLTVPAQQKIRWGFGTPAFQNNQGYMWWAFLDAGTGFQEGNIRLIQANAQSTAKFVVAEMNTSDLHTATLTTLLTATPISRDEQIALPEKVEFKKVGEDSLMQIEHQTTVVTTTVDVGGFSIPATIYQ